MSGHPKEYKAFLIYFIMKLFITNKKEFEDHFSFNLGLCKTIHINAYNELKLSIDAFNSIPKMLSPSYDKEGIAIFSFISLKDDVYFYSFISTAK